MLVAIAAPFVLAPLVAQRARAHDRQVHVALRVDNERVEEGQSVQVSVRLRAAAPVDAALVRLGARGITPAGRAAVVTALPGGADVEVGFDCTAPRWGRQQAGPVRVDLYPDALTFAATVTAPAAHVSVMPVVSPFAASEAIPRSNAYAGSHRSRALGPGVDFAGVREFAPGDSMRRVNWRATARIRELAVTETHTDRGADVVVVLDALYDVGRRGESSLDAAVRAAAGIAEHYLRLGDSVGLFEYGGRQRMLAPDTGRAQLTRVRDWLLDTHGWVTHAVSDVRWPRVFAARAPLTVVLTPLVDEASATLLTQLRLRGTTVVAIDTMPPGALPAPTDAVDMLARRLWVLERETLVGRLGDVGVPVVAWAGAEHIEGVLRDLARMASAPRAVLR